VAAAVAVDLMDRLILRAAQAGQELSLFLICPGCSAAQAVRLLLVVDITSIHSQAQAHLRRKTWRLLATK
jgi:hypothetical protein